MGSTTKCFGIRARLFALGTKALLAKISSGEANITFANDPKLAEIPALKTKTSNQVAASTSSNVNTTYTVPPGKENFIIFPQLNDRGNEFPVPTRRDSRTVPRISIPSLASAESATTRKNKCHGPALAQGWPGAKPSMGSP